MVVCSRCKTENEDNSKFCSSCGNDLTINVDAPATEDLKNLANSLNEQAVRTEKEPFDLNRAISSIPSKTVEKIKKIGKKKIIAILVTLVAIIACISVTVGYIVPYAPHYFNGNKAVKANDFPTAIEEYENAKSFLNAKSKLDEAHFLYAEKMFGEKDYYGAALEYEKVNKYADTTDKLIDCGTKLLDAKEYEASLEVFKMVDGDKVAKQNSYATGMVEFEDESYSDAKNSFTSAGDYKDAKYMINVCDFKIADEYCKDGKFSNAKAVYGKLPQDFNYEGVTAADRIALLDNSQDLINAMGEWNATDYYIESRNVYKRNGSWDSWYWKSGEQNLSGQKLTLNCKLNENNTFDITGSVTYYRCDNYSSLSEYCRAKMNTERINIRNVTAIPSSYQIDSNTTLTYSDGVFSISYSERDNYSTYFYNVYSSSVTYGSR